MAYENINDLFGVHPEQSQYYFLDANIWIYAMSTTCMPNASDKGNQTYTDFFFKITDTELKPRPRILMCSLLMSEIINTYLRKYAMKDYLYKTYESKGNRPPATFDFKTNYRGTEHFENQYKLIRDEIKQYHESIHIIDDTFAELKPFTLLKNCPNELDFNDNYYYQLFKKLSFKQANYFFVTNDSDFKVNDIQILTKTKGLLDLKKS